MEDERRRASALHPVLGTGIGVDPTFLIPSLSLETRLPGCCLESILGLPQGLALVLQIKGMWGWEEAVQPRLMGRKGSYLFSFGSATKGKRGLFLKAFGSFPSGQLWDHKLHSQSTPRSPTLS